MSLVDNGVADETTILRTSSRAEGKQWRGHRFFRNEGTGAMIDFDFDVQGLGANDLRFRILGALKVKTPKPNAQRPTS
jgi:hypothetical protein